MKQKKVIGKEKMKVGIDIEDMWRFSLETMLLVFKEANERRNNPNVKRKCIHELINTSSVKPLKIIVYSDENDDGIAVDSNYTPQMNEARDNYRKDEYPTCTKLETPRYII